MNLSEDIFENDNLLEDFLDGNMLEMFNEALSNMPKQDNDPIYERIKNYPVYREGEIPSQDHKK